MKKTLLFSLLILTFSCNTKKEENNRNDDLIKLNQDSLASTNDNDSIKINPNDFLEYNYPNRFSICFPKNWNVKEIEPNNVNQLHGFTILAEYGSRNISISEISRMFSNRNKMNSIFEIDFNDFIKPIPDLFENYKLVYSEKTKLCNYDAYKIKISYDTKSIIDGSKINSYNIFYDILEPKSKNIYSICYTSTDPSSDDFETTFHYVVKTFKLLNSSINTISNTNSNSKQNHKIESKLPNGWSNYLVKNNLKINIPPTMELQKGEFKKMVNSYYEALDLSIPNFVFQQKGVNQKDLNASQRYARIMLDITYGHPNQFRNLKFNVNAIAKSEIDKINSELFESLSEYYNQNNIKMIKWNPAKYIIVNGMSCLNYSHIRKLGNRENVFVNNYVFENNDKMYNFTLSYRHDKESIYKSDFTDVLHSIYIW